MNRLDLLLGVATTIVSTAVPAAASDNDSEIREAFREFVHAFDDLEMTRFIACFSEDATVFTPTGDPRRIDGRRKIESFFQRVFDETRKSSGRTQPPYMHLDARDLLIQHLDNSAVLTVHLHEPDESIHRRTFVYRYASRRWQIVHLHASNGPPKA